MASAPALRLGVKSDPVEYRYSYPWLFRIMADEGVHRLQLGTFFEMYQLPDAWFLDLRQAAADRGVAIVSLFTAHRELGGFFRYEPGWAEVARRNYERYIAIGALLGAECVGSNPGAVMRDEMERKDAGIARYLAHMKELMAVAKSAGLARLTIEPMSCLAEPPTTPEELAAMAGELMAHHRAHPESTVPIGYCTDVSHGYADASGAVVHDHMTLLEAALPWTTEIHLKNTDERYGSTFGFSPSERDRGIIDIASVTALLRAQAGRLPVNELTGYLEIGGPKLGRDYSDRELEGQLRASLRYLREAFV